MAEIRLELVGGDSSIANMDVVFVHGLAGDAHATWQRDDSGTFWPSWLAQDVSGIAVWTLGYPHPASEWAGEAMDLYGRASSALTYVYNCLGTRPHFFVTHSFGGLLVKKMLQIALTMGNHDWTTAAGNTVGVIFLATPHSGAELAAIATKIPFFRASQAVRDLLPNTNELFELNIWFQQYSALRLIVGTYYEMHQVQAPLYRDMRRILRSCWNIPPRVVGRESASRHGLPIAVGKDHFGICKPDSREDNIYVDTKKLIIGALSGHKPPHAMSARRHGVTFDNQEHLYSEMYQWLRNNKVTSARFYQYSGKYVRSMVQMLVELGTSVELYLQDEDTANSLGAPQQSDWIRKERDIYQGTFSNLVRKPGQKIGDLKIYYITAPISIRAIIFDEKLIAIGWYWYTEIPKEDGTSYLEVRSHDTPGFLVDRNSEGFAQVRELILICDSLRTRRVVYEFPKKVDNADNTVSE